MIYVYLDCNKTQDYVFSSRRLRGIRNGSRAVDQADQEVRDLVRQMGGKVIRALGGVVIAKFPASQNADGFRRAARRQYLRYGIGIESACMEHPDPVDFYKDVLSPLLKEIRTKKDCPKDSVLGPPSTIIAATCDGSGRGAAQGLARVGPEIHRVNAIEQTKWVMPKDDPEAERLIWDQTNVKIPSTSEGIVAWSSSEEIEGKEVPGTSEERLLGIVFADVNGLGGLLEYVAKDEVRFKAFSSALRECLIESLEWALKDVLANPVSKEITKDANKDAIPFRLLFLGGDDLCFAIVGAYALPLTKLFIERFEKRSPQILQPLRADAPNHLPSCLTLSAGVVIAPYNYPTLSVRRLGQQGLEAHAKHMGRAWAIVNSGVYPPSLVDFYLVRNNVAGMLEDVRRLERKSYDASSNQQLALFGGPYLVGKSEDGQPHRASLRFLPLESLLESAKELTKIRASGKLKALPSLLSRDEANPLYREWWNHLGEYEQVWRSVCRRLEVPACRDKLPVRDHPYFNTPVLDALQLMPFALLQDRWER